MVDVARALDVSHGSVYRHFPSKAALPDAVTQRWLDRVSAPLEEIVAETGDPAGRLRTWVRQLAASKQSIAREDPELFATFRKVTAESGEVIDAHVDHLAAQLARIVQDGVADGVLASVDPQVSGRAVLQSTAMFHHPAHADEWADPALPDQLEAVLDLLLKGLLPRD